MTTTHSKTSQQKPLLAPMQTEKQCGAECGSSHRASKAAAAAAAALFTDTTEEEEGRSRVPSSVPSEPAVREYRAKQRPERGAVARREREYIQREERGERKREREKRGERRGLSEETQARTISCSVSQPEVPSPRFADRDEHGRRGHCRRLRETKAAGASTKDGESKGEREGGEGETKKSCSHMLSLLRSAATGGFWSDGWKRQFAQRASVCATHTHTHTHTERERELKDEREGGTGRKIFSSFSPFRLSLSFVPRSFYRTHTHTHTHIYAHTHTHTHTHTLTPSPHCTGAGPSGRAGRAQRPASLGMPPLPLPRLW